MDSNMGIAILAMDFVTMLADEIEMIGRSVDDSDWLVEKS